MATSKKISELTTASAITGSEIFPLVQSGETRQASVSLLISTQAPVQSVNGLTGIVLLDTNDLPSYGSNFNALVAAIASVSVRVDAVSVLTSVNTAAITSVNAVITSVNNAHTSVLNAITSINNAVTSVVSGPRPYNVVFDFGTSTVPLGEYPKVTPAGLTFYVLPSCSGSQVVFNTSAFPATIVSIPIMFPTSTTLGILQIGVSGTATWPAIATTSVAPGQTFGVWTSVSADPTLTGLVISFAGWYRP